MNHSPLLIDKRTISALKRDGKAFARQARRLNPQYTNKELEKGFTLAAILFEEFKVRGKPSDMPLDILAGIPPLVNLKGVDRDKAFSVMYGVLENATAIRKAADAGALK